jgi:hypothetical protein
MRPSSVLRVLVVVWALISIGVGVLAFAVVNSITGGSVSAAAKEAFETIPEAIMMTMGFNGSPLIVDVAYWLILALAVFATFRSK